MKIGLIGRKRGMTRVFTEEGDSVPVTVIEVSPNRVTQVKTEETDGYRAVQVTTGSRRADRLTRSEAGHYSAAGVEAVVARCEGSSRRDGVRINDQSSCLRISTSTDGSPRKFTAANRARG